MIYDGIHMDHMDRETEEALDNTTELLQEFINRQEKLREMSKSLEYYNYRLQYDSERDQNAVIINAIQWIRYHLWGNSIEVINNKTNNRFKRWKFKETYISGPTIYQFAKETLSIDDDLLLPVGSKDPRKYITYKNLILCIMNKCFPKEPTGIFAVINDYTYSIILHNIRQQIEEYINP